MKRHYPDGQRPAGAGQCHSLSKRQTHRQLFTIPNIKESLDGIGATFPVGSPATAVELPAGPYSYAAVAPIDSTDWSIITYYDASSLFKIEAGKFELHMEACNFFKIIYSAIDVVNYPIVQKNLTFTLNLDPEIPQRVITDDQRLAQVITNFLSNAVKFTGENGSITMDVNLRKNKGSECLLNLAVTDTGIGISEEQQKRLFNSFEQADNSIARKFDGTGLGLVISKSIIEAIGGSVGLESKLGKGSCFKFALWLKVCTDQAEETWEPHGSLPA